MQSHSSQRMRERGLRPTPARLCIMEELERRQDHPTVEQLRRALRASGHPISAATLYQNLGRLVGAGLLRRFKGPRGMMRFEAQLDPHHHLVCARCGRVLDARVDPEELRRLQPVDLVTGEPITGWELERVWLELSGVCPDCRQAP